MQCLKMEAFGRFIPRRLRSQLLVLSEDRDEAEGMSVAGSSPGAGTKQLEAFWRNANRRVYLAE